MTQNNLGIALWALGERSGRAGGSAAAERGGRGLPPGPHRPHPRRPAPGLGHDPEQPGTALQIQVRLGGFPAGLEQVDRLAQAEGIRDDPVAQASLRTLAIVCHVATHQDAEASRAFASLVALVERQPADFHLVWDWTPLRDHLANSKAPPIPARREPLRKLLDAVSRDKQGRDPGRAQGGPGRVPGPGRGTRASKSTTAAPGPRCPRRSGSAPVRPARAEMERGAETGSQLESITSCVPFFSLPTARRCLCLRTGSGITEARPHPRSVAPAKNYMGKMDHPRLLCATEQVAPAALPSHFRASGSKGERWK